MNQVLTWIETYSPVTVFLLIFISISAFLLRQTAEKAISTQFEKYSKDVELRLERTSKFKEQILLDSYKVSIELEACLLNINLNLARAVKGNAPSGFIVNGEIQSLSDLTYKLNTERYLLPPKICKILGIQRDILFKMVDAFNQKDSDLLSELDNNFMKQSDYFQHQMTKCFGLGKLGS